MLRLHCQLIICLSTIACVVIGSVSRAEPVAEGNQPLPWTASALERRLDDIDRELGGLAYPRLVGGLGPIGYRSADRDAADHQEWLEVNLQGAFLIDQVTLVPTLTHTADSRLASDGFPKAFRVLAIDDSSETVKVTELAAFSSDSELSSRTAPVIISFPPVQATLVRVVAKELSRRVWDNRYDFALSELLVFCGKDNIALGKPIACSSENSRVESGRNPKFVVDGFLPYLIDAQTGSRSKAFFTALRDDEPCSITIDLEEPRSIDCIRLHAADVSDNVPQTHANDFGIPRQLQIDGSLIGDFSDAMPLATHRAGTTLRRGPTLNLRCPPTVCQFVRLTCLLPHRSTMSAKTFLGFAEIECLSKGRNHALEKPVTTSLAPATFSRPNSLSAITDGNNYYGEILPTRTWLEQLARRYDLEQARPVLVNMLTETYQRQDLLVQRLILGTLLLAAVIVALVFYDRYARQRAIYRTKEQIAADLHDELGANLHAIALCGDMAQANIREPDKLTDLLERIGTLAKRSAQSAKSCVNLLEARNLYDGLVPDLKRASGRLLADLEHDFTVSGESRLEQLSPQTQVGIALFYKECLTNVIRHSLATHVTTNLTVGPHDLVLTVTDNGRGIDATAASSAGDPTPPSLVRRARLLGGTALAYSPPEGGTVTTLRRSLADRWFQR